MAACCAGVLAFGGCGGHGSGPVAGGLPTAPRAVAEAWVRALDARDFKRACALSYRPPGACPRLLKNAVGRQRPTLRVVGYYFNATDATALVWLAGRPAWRNVRLVRRAGGYRVHFEVTIIR